MLSQEAQTTSEVALKELDARFLGIIVALAVILVTIVKLCVIKCELDDLEAQRARRKSPDVKAA